MTGSGTDSAAVVGQRVHALRTAKGLTQRQLAEPRYTAAYVSSVEAGRRTPSTDALAHFAERLGVSRQQLATGRSEALGVHLLQTLAETGLRAPLDPAGARVAYLELAAEPEVAADAHAGLGRLALAAGDLAAAAEHFAEAERAGAGLPAHRRAAAVAGRAACVRRQGDPRYAAYLLTRAVDELHAAGLPDPAALLALHAHLAVCLGQAEEWAEAAGAAQVALALAGAWAEQVAAGHVTVGRTLLELGDSRGAETALRQAIEAQHRAELRVELAWCHRARGRRLLEQGDPAQAEADLSVAAAALPAAVAELAQTYRLLGRPAEARRALVGADDTPDVERIRGLLAADAADLEAAERHLRAAVDGHRRAGAGPQLATVVLELADLLDAQERAEEVTHLLHIGLSDVEQIAGERAMAGTEATPHR
ncbi:helix-turn-helix transcriptional regulator [Dactylosporangium sp. NPDC049525]|uniref:helix-turn-helix transcriptional regulator n=1 Tax=Dactylosporangium sp. NPDC049525 TaxID=3154730 RepID=UPI00343C062A